MYQSFGQASVALPHLELPRCYSKEFNRCLVDSASTYPGCHTWHEAWAKQDEATDAAIELAIDEVPLCSEADFDRERLRWAVGSGLVGALLGALAATLAT